MSRTAAWRLRGRIVRRLLIDWLIDPELVADLLPPGLEVRTLDGRAVVGMCLIELDQLRPDRLVPNLGWSLDAVAHRVSVRTAEGRPGVYVPRRDTPSIAARALGGRAWPGVHGEADLRWTESGSTLEVDGRLRDGAVRVRIERATPGDAAVAAALRDVHAEELVAWSPNRRSRLEAAELRCDRFDAVPVTALEARSTWVGGLGGDPGLAWALEMRDVPMRWSAAPELARIGAPIGVGVP